MFRLTFFVVAFIATISCQDQSQGIQQVGTAIKIPLIRSSSQSLREKRQATDTASHPVASQPVDSQSSVSHQLVPILNQLNQMATIPLEQILLVVEHKLKKMNMEWENQHQVRKREICKLIYFFFFQLKNKNKLSILSWWTHWVCTIYWRAISFAYHLDIKFEIPRKWTRKSQHNSC